MGNSASALPYSIGKQVSLVNDGWTLHEGSRKNDGGIVSVFVSKKPTLNKTPLNRREPNITQLNAAKHHFIHCKKLRHPHILQVLATLDTDNPNDSTGGGSGGTGPNSTVSTNGSTGISNGGLSSSSTNESGDLIIVTEPCIPMEEWLTKYHPTSEQIAYGLESIVKALHFLHTSDMSYSHGNIHPSSFYVTRSGDVKMWNFSLVTPVVQQQQSGVGTTLLSRHFIEHEHLITPDLYRSPERVEKRWDAIVAGGPHVMDSYSLGILIGYIFHDEIPQKLIKAVQRLQTTNIKMRPKVLPLLKCPVFDTPYQKLQLQLLEIQIQPVEQKISFWNNTMPMLQAQLIPELLAVHKLLPIIKHTIDTICNNESMRSQEMYRREVQSTLASFFYIAETYLSKDDCKKLAPYFKTLFTVNDRAIRGFLLQKAPFLEQTLDPDSLNTSVFEPLCSGFTDSSPALRELTLKATSVLVPHLTHPNLEKLSRYLVRLQSDTEASIRTNTVIFFSKLAPYLTETTRQKMLLPAFVRAMKDPFTPCRNAALKSTLKAKDFFDPNGIASRVLPVITPHLLDPAPEVRMEAFAAVDELVAVLRLESDRLTAVQQQQQQQQQPTTTTATTPQLQPQQVNGGYGGTSLPMQQSVPPYSVSSSSTTTTSIQQQAQQQSGSGGGSTPKAASGSSFSFGITSWMGSGSSSSKGEPVTAPPNPVNTAPYQHRQQTQQPAMPVTVTPPNTFGTYASGVQDSVDDDWNDDNNDIDDKDLDEDADGWGDVDDDIMDIKPAKVNVSNPPVGAKLSGPSVGGTKPTLFGTAATTTTSTAMSNGNLHNNDDEDGFFDAFEAKSAKPVLAAKKFGGSGKLVVPKSKSVGASAIKLTVSKPVIKKLSSLDNEDKIADGWDDF